MGVQSEAAVIARRKRIGILVAAAALMLALVPGAALADSGLVAASVGNTVFTAEDITFGRAYVGGWNKYTDHLNCYSKFTTTQRGTVTFTVSKPFDSEGEYGKLQFDLTTSRGDLVWWEQTSDAKLKSGSSFYVYNVCLEPGTYYLNITPGFTVTSGLITFDYRIDFAASKYVITDPNQDTSSASTIKVGKVYKGYFGSTYYSGHPDNCEAIAFKIPETGNYTVGIGNLSTLDGTTCIANLMFSDGTKSSIDSLYFKAVDSNGFRCRSFYLKKGVTGYITMENYSKDQIPYQVLVKKVSAKSKGNMGHVGVSLRKSSYAYTGRAIKPSITVKESGSYLGSGDYIVKYANNKKPGVATVKIIGIGEHYGTVTKNFKITPPSPRIARSSWGKSNLKIFLKKYSADVTGFQVRLSNYESMKNPKVFTIKGSKKRTLNVVSKKMILNKTCWAQIRAYKKTAGKATVYSKWGWRS